MKIPFGVYVGKDFEAIVVEKYIITFRRIDEKGYLESCLLRHDIQSDNFNCQGICRSAPILTRSNSRPKHWKYAFVGHNKLYANDKILAGEIGKQVFTFARNNNEFSFSFQDSNIYNTIQDEVFKMTEIKSKKIDITPERISECLIDWHLGCHENIETNNRDKFTSVEINTKKHMYIFSMLPGSFYCRAARYTACNSGIAFKQNFRQRRSQSSETYMFEDNCDVLQALAYDETKLTLNSCPIFNPIDIINNKLSEKQRNVILYRYDMNGRIKTTQSETAKALNISRQTVSRIEHDALNIMYDNLPHSEDGNIYWSVISFSDNQIILNGCQGDVYEWNKPIA